jgi:thiol-disulfide isomerase/thioredoxin
MLVKKILLPLFFIFASTAFLHAQSAAKTSAKKPQPLALKVHIDGLKGGECVFGFHYADKNSILDTAKVDANGWMEFKDTAAVPGGIYFIVLPGKKYFELILTDNQKFTVETDTIDLIGHMKITGNKENQYFYEYLNYLTAQQKQVEPIQAQIKRTKNKDSIAMLQKKTAAIDSTVKAYKRAYYKTKHPETFMAKVLAAMDEPDQIPYSKSPRKADGTIDSTYNYWNFKNHYWDGMDFTDDRLMRTPVYANKMKFYMEKLTAPHPDSIMKSADWLIEKTRPSKELFKYTLSSLTVQYETSKVMGYDAIFVHIVDKYYKTNQATWVSEEQTTKIINRSNQIAYTLLGKTAVNLMMKDTAGRMQMLQAVQAKYTIVIFWEPTCSHCKKELPLLKTYYDSLRAAGVSIEVYAIRSDMDSVNWKAYIKEHNLTWINVAARDAQELATAKYYYDVYSTPTMYITDEKKVIFGKRLDIDGLKSVMARKIEMDKKNGVKKTN